MNTFTRGLDPKVAMNIGTTTWDNLSTGHILRAKKFVGINDPELFRKSLSMKTTQDIDLLSFDIRQSCVFALDKREPYWSVSITKDTLITVCDIKRIYKTRKGKTKLVNIILQYRKINDNKASEHVIVLRGSFERFERYFEIVQRTRI